MKKTNVILPIILFVLLALVVFTGVFFQSVSTESEYLPRNYETDGSHSHSTDTVDNTGINFATGNSSLLNYGLVNNIVIFICFDGETESIQFPTSTVNSIMDGLNGECSLKNYYETISYGAFSVNSVYPTANSTYFVYKDTRSRSYYESISSASGVSRYSPESRLLNNAVASVSSYLKNQLDESDVDVDGDGYVDSVSFIVSGTYDAGDWGELMWPHAWNLDTITDLTSDGTHSNSISGAYVGDYTFTFADSFKTGLFAHEFGHVVGMPDLYHTEYDTDYLSVGNWDIMHLDLAIPQFPLSYMRSNYLGFLGKKQVQELTEGGSYSLKPTSVTKYDETVAYKITISAEESIWIEYRNNAVASYDVNLPSSGLIIYRVNNTVSGNTKGKHNSSSYPDEVFIYRPSVATTDEGGTKSQELYNLARATLNLEDGGRATLGNATSTTKYASDCIYLTNGTNTGIVVSVEQMTDEEITFTINLGKYDSSDISSSYVVGQNLRGENVKGEHYMYYGQIPDIRVMLRYSGRPSDIELTDFTVEYENKVCPEGQVAYAVFTDQNGERRLEFTLYVYDVVKYDATVISRPTTTRIAVGQNLDLSGLIIGVNYASGNVEKVRYDETDESDWQIVEGLDTSKHGRYDHVLIKYLDKIYFTLSGIIVESEIQRISIKETNTNHIVGDCFVEKYAVYGEFLDGTERLLETNEYTVSFLSDVAFERTISVIASTENTAVYAESYVYQVGSAVPVAIATDYVMQNVEYAQEPSFVGFNVTVTFDNGSTVSVPMENYTELLLNNFSPTKVGQQTLTAGLNYKAGYGGPSFSAVTNVYMRSFSCLTVSSEYVDIIKIDDLSNRIILSKEITLAELNSALNTRVYLTKTYADVSDTQNSYDLLIDAFSARKVGSNITLSLKTANGVNAITYGIYLLGDSDGDGEITDYDVDFWLDATLSGKENYYYLDANGDGKFTLTDFVLLLKKKGSAQ